MRSFQYHNRINADLNGGAQNEHEDILEAQPGKQHGRVVVGPGSHIVDHYDDDRQPKYEGGQKSLPPLGDLVLVVQTSKFVVARPQDRGEADGLFKFV